MSLRLEKAGSELTAAGFHRLLARLHPDSVVAADRYEALHQRLAGFFEWRGSHTPEDDADETLDRLARRLEEGVEIGNLDAYALGVARLVLLEALRRQERARHREAAATPPPASPPEAEARSRCLEGCLATLAAGEREMVLAYYREEGGSQIAARKALAARLGIAPYTLRSRVFRIRERLGGCVRGCLARLAAGRSWSES